MGSQAQVPTLEDYLGRQLVKHGSQFLVKFSETRRMTGGGDAGVQNGQKMMPPLRRSARLRPAPEREDGDQEVATTMRRLRRRADVLMPPAPNQDEKKEEDAQKARSRRRRAGFFVPPEPNQDEIGEENPQKERRRGRRAEIYVPPVPSQEELDERQAKKTRRRRRSEVFVPPPEEPYDVPNAENQVNETPQKARRRGRRAEIYVPPVPSQEEVDERQAKKTRRRRRSEVFVPPPEEPYDVPNAENQVNETPQKVRRRGRRAEIYVPPVPSQDEVEENLTQKLKRRRRRSEVFVPPPEEPYDAPNVENQVNETPQKARRRGRRAEIYVPPAPSQDGVDETLVQNPERRSEVVVQPPPEEPNEVPRVKKAVRFGKTVKTKLFAMEPASPRKEGRWYRQRIQMGEPLNVDEPREDRRLKRPRENQQAVPMLTTRQRKAILGTATQVLSAERQMELILDSGCKSTCSVKGCGSWCLCLLNGIDCDDRQCPCTEDTCTNSRDDLFPEEPEMLRMRIEIANFELEEMSFGSNHDTICSVDNITINTMYSSNAGDMADMDGRDDTETDSKENATTTESVEEIAEVPEVEPPDGQDAPTPPDAPDDIDFGDSTAAGMIDRRSDGAGSNGLEDDDTVADKSGDEADKDTAEDEEVEEEDGKEEEKKADNTSDSSGNHTDDDDDDVDYPAPYNGPPPNGRDAPTPPDAPDDIDFGDSTAAGMIDRRSDGSGMNDDARSDGSVDDDSVVDESGDEADKEETAEEEEVEEEEEEKKADDTSDSSGNHTDDDDDDNNPAPYNGPLPNVGINLNVEEFPPDLLDQLPGMVDADARDSCDDGEYLESSALLIGLMKEASHFNHNNATSGSRCAVLHPEIFPEAMRLAEKDEAEKARRKAAKIKDAAAPLQLKPQVVAESVVYGNEWSHLLIPMHLSGNHWAVAVVMRDRVSAVIFDSLDDKKLEKRPKATTEQIKNAVKKILEAIQATNNHDTTGRFKVRFTWKQYREQQKDGVSCGIFSIVHARRALENGNSNANKKNGPKVNPGAERIALRATIVELMAFFGNLEGRKEKLLHGPAGYLQFSPKKTLVTLRY